MDGAFALTMPKAYAPLVQHEKQTPEPPQPSMDDVLRRMLATPPQPKKAKQPPKKPSK